MTYKTILTIEETKAQFAVNSWQSIVLAELEATLTSKTRPFPCIFGVAGLQSNQLRFAFSDRMDPADVAKALLEFLPNARSFGRNTSLVLFSRPGPVESIEAYEARFWAILQALHALDPAPWPETIPEALDHADWEFCFGGEPIFVVCNTPAHTLRQSRRASSFMITFQPRWVFEPIMGTEEAAKRNIAAVRQRLTPYDIVAQNPHLGRYGDPQNREFKQYFLHEHNGELTCPFAKLGQKSEKDDKHNNQKTTNTISLKKDVA